MFKPDIDDRYNIQRVTSHNGQDFGAIPVRDSAALLARVEPDTTVVAIDEAQFFDHGIVRVTNHPPTTGCG